MHHQCIISATIDAISVSSTNEMMQIYLLCEIKCYTEKSSAQHNMAGLGGSFDSLLDGMMRKKIA